MPVKDDGGLAASCASSRWAVRAVSHRWEDKDTPDVWNSSVIMILKLIELGIGTGKLW